MALTFEIPKKRAIWMGQCLSLLKDLESLAKCYDEAHPSTYSSGRLMKTISVLPSLFSPSLSSHISVKLPDRRCWEMGLRTANKGLSEYTTCWRASMVLGLALTQRVSVILFISCLSQMRHAWSFYHVQQKNLHAHSPCISQSTIHPTAYKFRESIHILRKLGGVCLMLYDGKYTT